MKEVILAPGGDEAQSGTYLLRICVSQDERLAFGRFRGGRQILVPAGDYVYVGSAMGKRGSPLAARALRHCTRRAPRPPHHIRAGLLAVFSQIGLGGGKLYPPQDKKLHWHIDYLVDLPSVEIVQVFILRSAERMEGRAARWLAAQPETAVLAKGLGAGDVPGGTHLLRALAGARWWGTLKKEWESGRVP